MASRASQVGPAGSSSSTGTNFSFSEHLQKDVLWVQDGTKDIDRYFLGPPEDFIDGKRMLLNISGRAVLVFRPQTKKTSPQKDNVKEAKSPVKEKLKRPSNPFLLYRRDYHKLVKAANPGYNNNQICKFASLTPWALSHEHQLWSSEGHGGKRIRRPRRSTIEWQKR